MNTFISKNQLGYVGLGALVGAAVAIVASKSNLKMAGCRDRKGNVSEYLRQSGEGSGESAEDIMNHDEKVFQEEVSAAN